MPIITAVVKHSAQRIYSDATGAYAVTFGSQSNDVWRLVDADGTLAHLTTFNTRISYHPRVPPIIDTQRTRILIPQRSRLLTIALDTGRLLQPLELPGNFQIDCVPLHLAVRAGRALLALEDRAGPFVVALDVVGDRGIEWSTHVPPDLQSSSAADRTRSTFNAVHLSEDGDVVCAFSRGPGFVESITLLRWSVGPSESESPAARKELPILLEAESYKAIQIKSCVPLGADAFVMCAWEELPDYPWGPKTCQSVLRALDTQTLDVRWTLQLWSRVHHVRYSAALNRIFILGAHNPAVFRDDPDEEPTMFVAALDAATGSLLRLENVNLLLKFARLDRDAVIVAYNNGDLCITPFDVFVDRGLAGDRFSAASPRAGDAVEIVHVAVSGSSAIVATEDALLSVRL
ncbi:hypothetical protein EXIGLDRAFT_736069 [Exidia glandulosa HHB12029]|uniref:Uncharacterized protein n=1 Tax=Exidia glandulosa HHB12029 TaxID=1314781 RepID=A0A165JL45_EXIGL|nr:hypothetical protein EXIGLDRAFT_736069 [Exidia glandulosa HHB12029]